MRSVQKRAGLLMASLFASELPQLLIANSAESGLGSLKYDTRSQLQHDHRNLKNAHRTLIVQTSASSSTNMRGLLKNMGVYHTEHIWKMDGKRNPNGEVAGKMMGRRATIYVLRRIATRLIVRISSSQQSLTRNASLQQEIASPHPLSSQKVDYQSFVVFQETHGQGLNHIQNFFMNLG